MESTSLESYELYRGVTEYSVMTDESDWFKKITVYYDNEGWGSYIRDTSFEVLTGGIAVNKR
jgi:hypothetical protein